MIVDDAGTPVAREGRPWWFLPPVAAIALVAILASLVPDPPSPMPPCSPPDARLEVVVDRFLSRLGSSPEAISECWVAGRLSVAELSWYTEARPPTRYQFGTYSEGRGLTGEIYYAVQVFPTWGGAPPAGWGDTFRWIMLQRFDRPTRWMVFETQPPFAP